MKHVLLNLLFFMATITSFAASGIIEGRVLDEANAPILGAIVKLDGTSFGASTDMDGKFIIKNIPFATYTITASFISYDKKSIADIKVEDAKIQTINIVLTKSSKGTGEVTIKGTRKKESLNAMLVQQKNLATISDGISAETIRRSPDKNTGDVLKRVTGLSISEGKFVIVRGLIDRYNVALLNGSILPSSEADRKAFSFDLFPSNMIDNISVVKAATPDMPGEFAGGIIDIVSKDIPTENFVNLQIGTGMNTQGTFKSYVDTKNGKKDFLGVDDGTRALPSAFPTTSDFQNSLTNQQKYDATKTLTNDWGLTTHKSMAPNRVIQATAGYTHTFKSNATLGIIGAISYNRSQRFNFVTRKEFEIGTTPTATYIDTVAKDNVLAGALLNIGLKINAKNKITLRNNYNLNSEDQTITRTGNSVINEQLIKGSASQFVSNRLITNQLSGEHTISKRKIKLQWSLGQNNIFRNTPDLRKTFYVKNTNDINDTVWRANVPINRGSAIYAGKFYSTVKERISNGKLDLAVPFSIKNVNQAVKVGAYYQQKNRDFDSRVLGYAISNAATFNNDLLTLPQDQIFNEEHIGANGFRIDDVTAPSDKYDANSTLQSAYLMLDNKFLENFRVVYGVRYEGFNQEVNSMISKTEPYKVTQTNHDFLPSANLTYSLNKKTNLRLCASKTLSRPEFRELARFSFYDFNTSSVILGNENLKQATIHNYDFRYETYPGKGELFSFTVFYKKFDNPIEQSVKSFRDRTYKNALMANNFGAEMEFRKSMGFLSSKEKSTWDNLTIFGNVAVIKSKVKFSEAEAATNKERPLQGQSPYLINIGTSYIDAENGFGATLLYNRIGARLSEVGLIQVYPDVYEKSRDVIDFQISKLFYKKLEVRLNFSDLLHQPYLFYQNDDFGSKYTSTSNVITKTDLGSSIGLSCSYKF